MKIDRSRNTPEPHVLTTKLYPPKIYGTIISRPRLSLRLVKSIYRCPLTLVSATAGYGKTTLVVESLPLIKGRVAWLSLDENDNDPIRFITYFLSALQTVEPQLGQAVFSLLGSTELPNPEALMAEILNELDEQSEPLTMVLDDYHVIDNQFIHQAVHFLLEQAPPNFHLIITTREDPPFPLPRWRVRQRINELRSDDLRFELAEIKDFFNLCLPSPLTETELSELRDRTEGWIAGLQLAALSMQRLKPDQIEQFVKNFHGSHHFVIDYLVTEVLRQLRPELNRFLKQTAILSRFTASLCDAVTGLENSQTIIAELEQSNLFLIPLDDRREWFRYHHLFADFLRTELTKEAREELHQRAARWFETEGFYDEAIQHFLAAANYEEAARLLRITAEEMIQRSEIRSWLKWVAKLPIDLVKNDTELLVRVAWANFFTGKVEETKRILMQLSDEQEHLAPNITGQLLIIKAWIANFYSSPEAGVLAEEALKIIDQDSPLLRVSTLLPLGTDLVRKGSTEEAIRIFREAYQIGLELTHPLVAVTSLMNLAYSLEIYGQFGQAISLCQTAFTELTDGTGKPLPVVDLVYIPLSLFYYQANDLEKAREYSERGMFIARQVLSQAIMGGDAEYVLIRTYFAQGQPELAFTELERIREKVRSIGFIAVVDAFDAIEADLRLKLGDLGPVRKWVESIEASLAELSPYRNELKFLTYSRYLLAENRPEEATLLLKKLEQAAKTGRRFGRLIKILVLQALTQNLLNNSIQAREYLSEAIQLGAPDGVYRIFLDEGPGLVKILPQVRQISPKFVGQLLDNLQGNRPLDAPKPKVEGLIESLSERELEVLHLADQGMTNQEIAAKLVITLGTTKWHLNNIFGKLGVDNRTRATVRARELGLL